MLVPMNDTCWMRLANGWTVSLQTDTPPAICCIAAWPTRQDNLAWASNTFKEVDLFDFGDGRTDYRCWSYGDVREALKKIAAATSPNEHKM